MCGYEQPAHWFNEYLSYQQVFNKSSRKAAQISRDVVLQLPIEGRQRRPHGLNWRKKRSSQVTSCDTYAELCEYSRPPTSCAASRISSPTVNDDNTPVDDDDDDAETTYSDTDGCNCDAVPWASLLQTQENKKDKWKWWHYIAQCRQQEGHLCQHVQSGRRCVKKCLSGFVIVPTLQSVFIHTQLLVSIKCYRLTYCSALLWSYKTIVTRC